MFSPFANDLQYDAELALKAMRSNDADKLRTLLDSRCGRLNLFASRVEPDHVQLLASVLEHNFGIDELNLQDNAIGDVGAAALAAMLVHNTSLTELHLGSNGIANTGAESLATALHSNRALVTLGLSGNRISSAGAQALCDALRTNTRITAVEMGANYHFVAPGSTINVTLQEIAAICEVRSGNASGEWFSPCSCIVCV